MALGFIGTGTITAAMVTGLHSGGGWEREIVLSPQNAAVAAELAERFRSVSVAASNQEVLDRSETVVIAVRPQVTREVLGALRFREEHRVISLVSGFAVGKLAELVAPAARITRAVPLPRAARRESPTAVYPRDEEAVALFTRLGAAFAVDTERQFDVLCTATATMATYFALADGAASWLARKGIAEDEAREYVAQIFGGLAATARETPGRSFAMLATEHATRGGTNEQVLRYMREAGACERFSEALDGILRRVTGVVTPV